MANVIRLKRASGSDPTASDLVSGEPAVRTDTGELFFKKDDGSVAKVSGAGGGPDFKYLALRNAANNGAASYPNADFTLVRSGTTTAINPTAANTLLVSVNGVIQKPNTGTSTPSEGFALNGSTIKFGGNISTAPDFILYQESGGIGEPSDDTVSEVKLKVSNSPVNGYFLSAQSGNTGGLTWAAPVATSCTGNSATATALETARTINGTSFDGTANITVTAAAGTLTGTTLNSSVTASSLTSLGDLSGLTVTGNLAVDTSTLFVNASTNRVGIGTTSPSGLLSLQTNNPNIRFDDSDTSNNAEITLDNTQLRIEVDEDNAVGSSAIKFRVDGSDKAVINSSGNVGIGTTAVDGNKLAVLSGGDGVGIYRDFTGSGGAGVVLNLGRKNSSGSLTKAAAITGVGSDNSGTAGELRFSTVASSSLTERMRITSAGLVGIGTSSPSYKLDIFEAAGNGLRIKAGDATADIALSVGSAGTADKFIIQAGGNVQIPIDSVFLQIGAGQDLDLHHNGTNSYIRNKTGDLHIRPLVSEEGIILKPNGAVELYWDNSKKFETYQYGIKTTQNIDIGTHAYLGDNGEVNLGDNQDFVIFHDGTTNVLNGKFHPIELRHQSEVHIKCVDDGAVELYHNNSKKFETTANGVEVSAGRLDVGSVTLDGGGLSLTDNDKLKCGAGDDLQIFHDGTNSFIKDTAGAAFNILATESIAIKTNNTEFAIACNKNGSVELYYDNNKKFETTTFGASMTGSLEVTAHFYAPDNGKLLLGNAQDFEFFHDGAVSLIRSSSHPIGYYSNTRHHFLNADGSENMAVFTTNGACELYHDGTKRIFTEANGGAIGGTSRFLGHGNATGANATEVHFNSNSGHFGIHFSGHGNTGNTYTAARMVINGTGGTYGTITYSLSGTGYNSQSSDRRSKKNIVEWTESELDKFKNLQPKLFHFDHNINSDPKYKGYIAQDNLAAFPEAYPLVDDRYMFNPSGMVVYLMKAVQELTAKVEALEAK